MNYRVLAVSTVIGVGLIAVGLVQTKLPDRERRVDRFPAQAKADLPPSDAYPVAPAMVPPVDRLATASIEPPAAPITTPRPPDDLEIPAAGIPVGLPHVAYVFSYGFRLAGADIPALQQRHADLCESKGPLTCRIVAMNQSSDSGADSAGTLQLAVAASEARAFGRQLASAAESADAEQVSAAIAGEDLSKQIVDTEARLRARTLLRDRLMEVLATRRGTVGELVEAERGVAQVNEEIDQARSWLTQMKARVAYSQIDIHYASAAPPEPTRGFMDPVRGAVGVLGAVLGTILAVLIVLGAIGAPVLAGVLGVRAVQRKLRPAAAEA